jgi:hypothetical protein
MLILNPQAVKFGPTTWEDVAAITIDRAAERTILEWTDSGPHPALADVPEQLVTIKVTRRLLRDDLSSPAPGQSAELVFCTSPTAAQGGRKRARATVVVTSVVHQLTGQRSGADPGALRTITMLCISSDGAADPITIEDASDGSL